MKPKSRILSLLLAICLVVGLMPTTAFAAEGDKTIMPGTSGISGYDGTNGYDYIYYGTWNGSPIKWRVLDDQTNTGSTGLFLLSDVLLGSGDFGGVYFDNSSPYSNVWQGSDAQTWCENFYSSNFSTGEQSAVLSTTKDDEAFTSSTSDAPFAASVNILNGDKVFFLSAEEAEKSEYGFDSNTTRVANYGDSAGVWWLRSPYANDTDDAGVVLDFGIVNNDYVFHDWAARPAFNLDLKSVLFSSAAEGGKISAAESGNNQGGEAADAIFEIGDYAGNEWKLTLLDDDRNFAAATTAVTGDTLTLSYSGAATGANEYISAIIKDNSGNITHYGRLKNTTETADASGTVNIDLSGIDMTSKTLYVFSEQYNGDYMTDYASALQEISLNVLSKETTPQAVFTAAGDSSGTLSNVDASMKYSTDGSASWTDITGTTAEITGVTADKDIQVVKKGDGTTTVDSDAQIIDVTQAAQPAGIGKTDCTTAAQNDGTITGVDSTMEYRLSAASEWTSISGNTVSGLANGTYDVRVRANGTVLSSEVATVTIGAHTCAAQGDWQHDANEHWKLCACGAEVDRAAHTGGTATCTEKAVCDICGEEYGELNASNHTNLVKTEAKAATHMTEGNIEYWYCDGCDKYFSDEAGTQEIALADTVIPKLTEHTTDGSGWHSDETGHWNTCECGEKLNEAAHTFEWVIDKEATAAEAGSKHEECTVCGYAKAAVEIPATGDTTSPETGDDSNIALWITVMLAAGAALTGTILYSRKRRYSR